MNDTSRKKDPERNKEEERRILQLRIRKKKEEIIQEKEKWTEMSKRTMETSKLSLIANQRIRMIKQAELMKVWTKEKEKMLKKIENINLKQNPIQQKVPGTYRDITIGDKDRDQ